MLAIIVTAVGTASTAEIYIGVKLLPTGFIVIPIYELILRIENVLKQILCIAFEFPILNIAVIIGIKIIVIRTQKSPQFVAIEIILRFPIVDRRFAPVPVVGFIFKVFFISTKSSQTFFPIRSIADFKYFLIEVINKLRVILFSFGKVIVLRRISAESKTTA